MIVFASALAEPEPYSRFAEPGIRLARESDSIVLAYSAVDSISRSYNLLLERASVIDHLEALVLIEPHTEIIDSEFCAKIRAILADPAISAVGCLGARDFRGTAWWNGSVSGVNVDHVYREFGGGLMPSLGTDTKVPAPGEVDSIDGMLMVLSPWAVRNVRFDEELVFGHGYDIDYCYQLSDRGRKVVTADLGIRQHRSIDVISDHAVWVEAHIQIANKWAAATNDDDVNSANWEQRARRAEAERDAAKVYAYSKALEVDARVLELSRQLAEYTDTRSWRLTEPLRKANARRNARRPSES